VTVFPRWLLFVYTKWTVFIKYLLIKWSVHLQRSQCFGLHGASLCYSVSFWLFWALL